MRGWSRFAGSGPRTSMRSNATSTARTSRPDARPARGGVAKEEHDEDQADQRLRGRPGEGAAFLHRGPGFHQEDRLQPGALSLADRGLARRAGGHRAAARAERRPRGEGLSACAVREWPTRGDVLHRRRQGRPRADQEERRRGYDAPHRRDRLDHRAVERHLRQPRSAHGAPLVNRALYTPGPAADARVEKDGEAWTLVLVRELRHAPDKVWQALTDPAQLREWAPFDADTSLAKAGATVKLTTVGTPLVSVTKVTRADPPRELVYDWGGREVRWQLEPRGGGARLTLWTSIDRRYIAMGAAGWHVCLDVLDHLLGGAPIGRIVAEEALQFEG